MYTIRLTKKATKDQTYLKAVNLDKKAKELLNIISKNPFQSPPPFKGLLGHCQGLYSRRLNMQHRLVYEVYENIKTVRVISMWSHYDF